MKLLRFQTLTLLACMSIVLLAFAPLSLHAESVGSKDNFHGAISNAPSIAELTSFTAKVINGKQVRIKWVTGAEYTLVGFNLYRKQKNSGDWVKLNQTLLPPNTPGSLQGSAYALTDRQVTRGKSYQYRLELVGAYGNTASSEIVTVKIR